MPREMHPLPEGLEARLPGEGGVDRVPEGEEPLLVHGTLQPGEGFVVVVASGTTGKPGRLDSTRAFSLPRAEARAGRLDPRWPGSGGRSE